MTLSSDNQKITYIMYQTHYIPTHYIYNVPNTLHTNTLCINTKYIDSKCDGVKKRIMH